MISWHVTFGLEATFLSFKISLLCILYWFYQHCWHVPVVTLNKFLSYPFFLFIIKLWYMMDARFLAGCIKCKSALSYIAVNCQLCKILKSLRICRCLHLSFSYVSLFLRNLQMEPNLAEKLLGYSSTLFVIFFSFGT